MARRAHATIFHSGHDEDLLARQLQEVEALRDLLPDWNGYAAPPPNPSALDAARRALQILSRFDSLPERVLPSADGGVALVLSTQPLYTALEIFNDGDFLASLSDRDRRHDVWDARIEEASIREALERFRSFS